MIDARTPRAVPRRVDGAQSIAVPVPTLDPACRPAIAALPRTRWRGSLAKGDAAYGDQHRVRAARQRPHRARRISTRSSAISCCRHAAGVGEPMPRAGRCG